MHANEVYSPRWRPDGRCKSAAGSELPPAWLRRLRSTISSCGPRRHPRCILKMDQQVLTLRKHQFTKISHSKLSHARVEEEACVGEALDGGAPAAGSGGGEEGSELVAVQDGRQSTGGGAGEQHLRDPIGMHACEQSMQAGFRKLADFRFKIGSKNGFTFFFFSQI